MNNLKDLRNKSKKSQQEVADYLGVSRQAYSHYENGKREPDLETLLKLGEYFECSVDEILRPSNEKKRPSSRMSAQSMTMILNSPSGEHGRLMTMFWMQSKHLQNSLGKTVEINNVEQLYCYAEYRDYDVYHYYLTSDNLESLSVMENADQKCYIAIDPSKIKSKADEFCKLLHEIGHCDRGAFYNQYSSLDIRKKHENTADKQAIRLAIPAEALDRAVAEGYDQIWSLAEYFGVTEDFMRKALCWHVYGNVESQLYF
jgi:transcriptional regulator with XRE-family HTH domain